MEELVIRDADVVDGSGEPSYRADVVVDRGRIVSIVKEAADAGCQRPRARRELDAEGLVLSPGFIDMHAHSDLAVLRDPDHRWVYLRDHDADLRTESFSPDGRSLIGVDIHGGVVLHDVPGLLAERPGFAG